MALIRGAAFIRSAALVRGFTVGVLIEEIPDRSFEKC